MAVRIDQQNRNIPLPLAQLKRRATNAKTGSERHLAAYYLWESGLKLLASVAIVEYARQPDPDPDLREMLKNLAKPSTGQWWEFLRRLVPVLADQGDERFRIARDLILGPTRDDLPRLAGMYCEVSKVLGEPDAPGARSTVRLTELFHRMVRYRNKVFAHGGLRSSDFHERMASVFLSGLSEMLDRVDMLAGRRLIYVPEITLDENGQPRIHRFELAGEEPQELPCWTVRERILDRLPKPKRLYLDNGRAADDDEPDLGQWTALHPLAVYDADLDEVLFLNGRRGKGKKRAGYMGYVSGNEQIELATDLTGLLARLLGEQVEESDLEAWAASSEANDPEPAVVQGEVAEPRRLGEFELLSRIGRGGMGVVYRAFQPSLGRQVALKRLGRPGDSQAAVRFAREIRALGKVDHPYLVKVYCSGSAGEDWFYAMELVEGVDLATLCGELAGSEVSAVDETQWIQALTTACRRARSQEEALGEGQTLPALSAERQYPAPAQPASTTPLCEGIGKNTSRSHIRRIVRLTKQVAQAVDALHRAHVIHRDIKPGNIMVDPSGSRAVVVDLGLAQLADEIDGRVTLTRQFVGTLRYASPEQLLLAGKVDYRTDIYSLGATLWELLTLRPLFGATDATPTPDLMLKIQSDDPESPRRYNPRIPADLEAIVLKCLEKNREKRYATAADLIDDIERWERDEPVRARKTGIVYRLAKGARRHRRSLASVAGAVVLLFVVALGFLGLHQHFSRTYEQERSRLAVKRLLEDVDTPNVPAVLRDMPWTPATIRLLKQAYDEPQNPRQQLHAALALVETGPIYVDFLFQQLLIATPPNFPVIRGALQPHATTRTEPLWKTLESSEPISTRFRAAMALAAFSAGDAVFAPSRWHPHLNLVADQLIEKVRYIPGDAEPLLAELAPIHELLLPRLHSIFHDVDVSRRQAAARILAQLYAEQPEQMARLIGAARDGVQRDCLVTAISQYGSQAVAILERELDSSISVFRSTPTKSVEAFPQAGWIVHEDFALCHAMPLDAWIQAADQLRPYGYRPVRCRPYYTPGGVLVASIWHRDRRDWTFAYDMSAEQIRQMNDDSITRGYVPVDVAGYLINTPDGTRHERYCGLWTEPESAEKNRRYYLYAGVKSGDHNSETATAQAQGYGPLTLQTYVGIQTTRHSGIWEHPSSLTRWQEMWDRTADKLDADVQSETTRLLGEHILTDASVSQAPTDIEPRMHWQQILRVAEANLARDPADSTAAFDWLWANFHLANWHTIVTDADKIAGGIDTIELTSLFFLCLAYACLGELDRALEYADRFCALENAAGWSRQHLRSLLTVWEGQHGEAFQNLERVLREVEGGSDFSFYLYDFACCYSVASSVIADRHPEKAEQYVERALQLLETLALLVGVDKDYARHIQVDTDMDPIRHLPRFRRVLGQLNQPRYAIVYARGDSVDASPRRTLVNLELHEHIDRSRELAEQGYLPAAFSVATGDGCNLTVVSSWTQVTEEVRDQRRSRLDSFWADKQVNVMLALQAIDYDSVRWQLAGRDELVADRLSKSSPEYRKWLDAWRGSDEGARWLEEQAWRQLEETKLKRLDWENTVGDAREWWIAFEEENKTRIALVLKVAEEIAKRRATITDFFDAYVASEADSVPVTLLYLDYAMVRKQPDADDLWKTEDGSEAELTDEELLVKLEEIKAEQLEWDKTEELARQWWLAFEEKNKTRTRFVLRVAQEMAERRVTITELYSVHRQLETESMRAMLTYIDYRVKRADASEETESVQFVEGITLQVDAPPEVTVGEDFEIEIRVHNSKDRAQTLDSIDVYRSYLEGVTLKHVMPEKESLRDYDSFVSYDYGNQVSIPAGGSITVRFVAEARRVGTYRGDFDVCINVSNRWVTHAMETRVVPVQPDAP